MELEAQRKGDIHASEYLDLEQPLEWRWFGEEKGTIVRVTPDGADATFRRLMEGNCDDSYIIEIVHRPGGKDGKRGPGDPPPFRHHHSATARQIREIIRREERIVDIPFWPNYNNSITLKILQEHHDLNLEAFKILKDKHKQEFLKILQERRKLKQEAVKILQERRSKPNQEAGGEKSPPRGRLVIYFPEECEKRLQRIEKGPDYEFKLPPLRRRKEKLQRQEEKEDE